MLLRIASFFVEFCRRWARSGQSVSRLHAFPVRCIYMSRKKISIEI